MTNWKTTVSAVFTVVFGFIMFSPEYFKDWPWLLSLAKYFTAGGMLALGFSAKDFNVTGGTKQNLPLFILFVLLTAGCAGQSTQVTVGKTLLTMHDLGKSSAEAANELCIKQVIKPEPCAKIKIAYDVFRRSWPIADDALVVYLKSSKDDATAYDTFQLAHTAFLSDYADLINLLAQVGVLKGGDK